MKKTLLLLALLASGCTGLSPVYADTNVSALRPIDFARKGIYKVDTIATAENGGSRYNLQELKSTDLGIGIYDAAELGTGIAVRVLGYYLDDNADPDGVFNGLGMYQIIHDATLTDNGGSIVAADYSFDTDSEANDAFWVLNGDEPSRVNIKTFGAVGDGMADDREPIQNALNASNGRVVFCPSGTYLIGASGSQMTYRLTTAEVGLVLPSETELVGEGFSTVFKAASASEACLLTATGAEHVSISNLRIDGNAINNTSDRAFGIYILNSSKVSIRNVWVYDTNSNTIQIMGTNDFIISNTYSETTGATSLGGGIQIEDCNNGNILGTLGSTYDDLFSVISHAANCTNLSLGEIQGTSESARALFIGLSGSATAQWILSNISASVNSHDCGSIGETAAFVINRGGIYRNIDVSIRDQSSYQAVRITPYGATYDGELKNSKFDVVSYNSDFYAVEVRHNDSSATVIENNALDVISKHANYADASPIAAVWIQGGDNWSINANIEYASGKTNPESAVLLGLSGAYAKVTNSVFGGVVNGGKTNLKLLNTAGVLIDSSIFQNSEGLINTAIEISELSSRTRLGTIVRDGEILNLSIDTQRSISMLYKSIAALDSSGTSETDLMSYTLPSDWMGKDGVVHVRASGQLVGSVGTKTLAFKFGSISRTLHIASAATVGPWVADIYIYQNGTRSAQKIDIIYYQNNAVVLTDFSTSSESTTSTLDIKFTGKTSSGDDSLVQELIIIEGY